MTKCDSLEFKNLILNQKNYSTFAASHHAYFYKIRSHDNPIERGGHRLAIVRINTVFLVCMLLLCPT